MSETFTVQVEQVTVPADKKEVGPVLSQRMSDILALIADPEKPVSEISRLIAGEIAVASGAISCLNQSDGYKLKFLSENIKSLRELSKTLSESEVLSKKDVLNFDGPKFQFVFQEIVGCFSKAAKESGLTDEQTNMVLRNFKDKVAQREPELRKQTEKIDATFLKR